MKVTSPFMSPVKLCSAFVGRKPITYGFGGLMTGFLTFLFDMLLAACLQRFFMATGLVTAGGQAPLGLDLASPSYEACFLIIVGTFRAASVWGNGHLSGLCQTAFETGKRRDVASWAIHSGKEEIGHVATLYNDVVIGAAATINNIFVITSRFVILLGLFGAMLWCSASMTCFVLLLMVVMAPIQLVIDKIVSRNATKIQQSLAVSVSRLTVAVKNNLFIQLHDFVEPEVQRISDQIRIYGHSTERYFCLSALRAGVPQVLGIVAVCLIAIQGSTYFTNNQSNLIAYLYLVLRLFQNLSDSARIGGSLRLNLPRMRVLWRWWKGSRTEASCGPVSHAGDFSHAPAGWRASHITYSYDHGHKTVLRDLSFDISPGSMTLVSGPSGAGKSTLLQMLVGLIVPSEGHLEWYAAERPSQKLTGRIPVRMAYVGPEPFLLAGSIRDQLMLGQDCAISDARLSEALVSARADFVFALPAGLDYRLTEQGSGLSAGQKQRLSLARALLRQPSILLLDEATANLDAETEEAVFDTVNGLRGEMTILVVSHRPPKKLKADQTIELALLIPERAAQDVEVDSTEDHS